MSNSRPRDMARQPGPLREDEVRKRIEVPPTHQSGAWSHDPGPVARPGTHEITRVDEQENAIRIHVELPPVDPMKVSVDAAAGEILVFIPQGTGEEIYCTIDVPLNVDVRRMTTSVVRGHLEIVLPKVEA